jgi:hypothetical protein
MEGSESFLEQFGPIGLQRRENQSDESSMSSWGKPSAFTDRVTGCLGGGVIHISEEDARGGSSNGSRRREVKVHFRLSSRRRGAWEIGRALGGADRERPMRAVDRVGCSPDGGGMA